MQKNKKFKMFYLSKYENFYLINENVQQSKKILAEAGYDWNKIIVKQEFEKNPNIYEILKKYRDESQRWKEDLSAETGELGFE